MQRSGARGLVDRVWDGLRRRCPVCRKGRIFAGAVTMNAQCPTCRYVFEREPGYFLGAIAIGYFLGVIIVVALAVGIRRIAPTLEWEWCFGFALVFYVLFTPIVFQYARTVWMYFDNWLDPPSP
jgi:uncharacterized protein (DUF983 family)